VSGNSIIGNDASLFYFTDVNVKVIDGNFINNGYLSLDSFTSPTSSINLTKLAA